VDEPNATGETPLISAVHRRDIAMVRSLLKAGANPDRADSAGRTARDYAKLRTAAIWPTRWSRPPSARGLQVSYGPSL
jgi:ankyrin repeat protein